MNTESKQMVWPYPSEEAPAIIEQAVADIRANRVGKWDSEAMRLLLALVELKNPNLRICRAVDQACADRGYQPPTQLDAPLEKLLNGTAAAFRKSGSIHA